MKKQVITLAALLMASNVAFAAQSSQKSSQKSSALAASTLEKLESASKTSVRVSTDAGNSVHDAYEAVKGEATQELRKGDVVGYGSGATLAVGAFVVRAVDVTMSATTKVTKAVLEGLHSGSKISLQVTEEITEPIAKNGDKLATYTADKTQSAASRIFNTGKGVVVGVSASGTILFMDAKEATREGLHSQLVNSSKTLIGSISRSASAFGSEVAEGFEKR